MLGSKKYNWAEIRLDFVSCALSIEQFAKEKGIPVSTIRNRSRKEGWHKDRKEYSAAMFQRAAVIHNESRAEKLAKVDEAFLRTAEQINDKLRTLLPSIDNPSALKALAGTLKDTQAVMRLALGASTDNQAVTNVTDFAKWLTEIEEDERNRAATH